MDRSSLIITGSRPGHGGCHHLTARTVRNLAGMLYAGERNKSWANAERAGELRSRLTSATAVEPRALAWKVSQVLSSVSRWLCKTCRNHLLPPCLCLTAHSLDRSTPGSRLRRRTFCMLAPVFLSSPTKEWLIDLATYFHVLQIIFTALTAFHPN